MLQSGLQDLQPQVVVIPDFKLAERTNVSFPQSHLQYHLDIRLDSSSGPLLITVK